MHGPNGPITDIVDRMDVAVDAIISGHSHVGYNCEYDGRLLTQAASAGRLITSLDLTIDNATGEVVEMMAENHIVTRDVTPDPAITAIISQYKTAAGPIGARVVGTIAATIPNVSASSGENQLGNLISDAQLAATAGEDTGEAVIAFMNPGGIRADLVAEANGSVTYEKAFVTQPFNNYLVTLTLTGAQIDTLLEQQWSGQTSPRILQVSEGFTYTWDGSKPDGQKVDAASIKRNGSVISAVATYRVTVNSFLADGGDNFVVLRQGTDRLVGGLDIDALEDYLTGNAPVPTPPLGRITAQNIPVPTPTPAPATPTTAPATPGIPASATVVASTATSVPATPARNIPMPPNTGGGGTSASGPGSVGIALIITGLLAIIAGISLVAVPRRSSRI